MKPIIIVGVRKLKDNISAYLREVKSGSIILITDRDRVIAELHEPTIGLAPGMDLSARDEWIREKKLVPPKTKKKKCPVSHLNLKSGISSYLLDQDREE